MSSASRNTAVRKSFWNRCDAATNRRPARRGREAVETAVSGIAVVRFGERPLLYCLAGRFELHAIFAFVPRRNWRRYSFCGCGRWLVGNSVVAFMAQVERGAANFLVCERSVVSRCGIIGLWQWKRADVGAPARLRRSRFRCVQSGVASTSRRQSALRARQTPLNWRLKFAPDGRAQAIG